MITTIERLHNELDIVVADEEEAMLVQKAVTMFVKHRWSDKSKKETDFPQWEMDDCWSAYVYGGWLMRRGSNLLEVLGEMLRRYVHRDFSSDRELIAQFPIEMIDFRVHEDRLPAMYTRLAKHVLTHMKELGITILTRDGQYGPYRLVTKEDYE